MEVPEMIDCFICFHCKESGESMEIWQYLKRLAGVWHFMMFWDCRVFDREMASSWQFRVWSSGYSCWWSTDIWPQLPSERYLDDDHRWSEFLWLSWLWRSWFMMTVAMLMMIYMMVIGKRHAFTFLQKCSWNPWQLAPHLWFHWVKNHHHMIIMIITIFILIIIGIKITYMTHLRQSAPAPSSWAFLKDFFLLFAKRMKGKDEKIMMAWWWRVKQRCAE